jgi:hypothetical protein
VKLDVDTRRPDPLLRPVQTERWIPSRQPARLPDAVPVAAEGTWLVSRGRGAGGGKSDHRTHQRGGLGPTSLLFDSNRPTLGRACVARGTVADESGENAGGGAARRRRRLNFQQPTA